MSRTELVAAATAAGIKNASRTKSVELINQLENMKVNKTVGRRGRPVVEGSARQVRLAAQAQRAQANGGVVKRGRPAKTKSEA